MTAKKAKKISKKASKSSPKKAKAKKTKSVKKAKKSAGKKTTSRKDSFSGIPRKLLLQIHELMVKSRVLEERLIAIYKKGESYFWIGAPGEEAFGVPLGLLINKGKGFSHDWLHLHYRCTPTLVAMGMPALGSIRLMMNRVTDPHTGGRNFSNHYCIPDWNVAPVSSPIEVQYSVAIGTAHAQKRRKAKGITVISGGDAGTAEGDFASCLVWASRKGNELPMLITVQNNRWGISTPYEEQHGEEYIADRGKGFGIRTAVINGNDPVESYLRLKEEMEYIRKKRKPVLLEAKVSRLYGHSSASGANFEKGEEDCLTTYQQRLFKAGHLKESEAKVIWEKYDREMKEAEQIAKAEAEPTPESIWDHIYCNDENADWRKF